MKKLLIQIFCLCFFVIIGSFIACSEEKKAAKSQGGELSETQPIKAIKEPVVEEPSAEAPPAEEPPLEEPPPEEPPMEMPPLEEPPGEDLPKE